MLLVTVVSLSFPLGQPLGLVAVGSGQAPAKSLDSEVKTRQNIGLLAVGSG